MTKRRRCVDTAIASCCSILTICGQPYIEQAAKDKERAEKEKKEYDVSPPYMRALDVC